MLLLLAHGPNSEEQGVIRLLEKEKSVTLMAQTLKLTKAGVQQAPHTGRFPRAGLRAVPHGLLMAPTPRLCSWGCLSLEEGKAH